MRLSKKTLKDIGEKWVLCLVFSFTLFIIVWLSEMLRLVIMDIAPNPYSLGNILYFFFMIFGVVPFILLALWLINPLVVKKTLQTFGFSEKSLEKKEKHSKDKNEENTMSRFRHLYHKFVEEIKEIGNIPRYDYEKVLKQIKDASYPATLGMINLGLYQYVKSVETPQYANPDIFFLIASFLFFFIAILIGLGIGIAMEEPLFSPDEQQEQKYRQAFAIVLAFAMAIIFDLLGLIFLLAMHLS